MTSGPSLCSFSSSPAVSVSHNPELSLLRSKYAMLGKAEWWWLFDDSIAQIGKKLAKDSYVVVDEFLPGSAVQVCAACTSSPNITAAARSSTVDLVSTQSAEQCDQVSSRRIYLQGPIPHPLRRPRVSARVAGETSNGRGRKGGFNSAASPAATAARPPYTRLLQCAET